MFWGNSLVFDTEDGGDMVLQNISWLVPDCLTCPRTLYNLYILSTICRKYVLLRDSIMWAFTVHSLYISLQNKAVIHKAHINWSVCHLKHFRYLQWYEFISCFALSSLEIASWHFLNICYLHYSLYLYRNHSSVWRRDIESVYVWTVGVEILYKFLLNI